MRSYVNTFVLAVFVITGGTFSLHDGRHMELGTPRQYNLGANAQILDCAALANRVYALTDSAVAIMNNQGRVISRFPAHAHRLVVASDGTIFIAEPYRIGVYNEKGHLLRKIGGKGTGAAQFGNYFYGAGDAMPGPEFLALGPDNTLYAFDQASAHLKMFSPKGSYLGNWNPKSVSFMAQSARNPPGNSINVFGVGIDRSNNVYIGENLGYQVWKFDHSGRLLARIGGKARSKSDPGKFVVEEDGGGPSSLCFDSAGHIFVADMGGEKVEVFAGDGTPLGHLPGQSWGLSIAGVDCLSATPQGFKRFPLTFR